MKTPEQIADEAFRAHWNGPTTRRLMALAIEADRAQRVLDRHAEARAALAQYDAAVAEPDDDPGYHKRVDAALDCIEPLRALIEPPATEETVEQITQRHFDLVAHGIVKGRGNTDRAQITWWGLFDQVESAVRAGIQAAWESWEPESAPGVRVVTREQYAAVCDVVDAAKMDDYSEDTDVYAGRIMDALGMVL